MNAISLFSSSGIGDMGLKTNFIKTVINCELLKERVELFKNNHPESFSFCGDIWELKSEIIQYYEEYFQEELFLLVATPPCQGMSSNGAGKLISDYRKGLRPKFDPRNRLIIPTMDVIEKLKPKWILFENVPNMKNTIIEDENGELVNLIEYIKNRLGEEYVGEPEVVEVADYGVPQSRKRLISIFTKTDEGKRYFEKEGTFLPKKTHSKEGIDGTEKWITLKDAVSHLPKLDGKKGKNEDKKFHPLHKAPVLTDEKYVWVSHTKEGDTAFNNQCINPECLYQENKLHGASTNEEGINKFNEDTPIFCEKCGSLLPRPNVVEKGSGEIRIMKGFTSAYKRMSWDEPASTLTQNFQYVSSDNKIHPEQNRVLSIYEAMILQTIANYDYSFEIEGKMVKDGLIRDSIGESVPPKLFDLICKNIKEINKS